MTLDTNIALSRIENKFIKVTIHNFVKKNYRQQKASD